MDHVQPVLPYDVSFPQAIRNYLLVAKPGIVLGNLVSVAGGFLLASGGRINTPVLLPTLTALCLVIASACVFNNCIDRDMDRKMARTHNRVLAKGLMPIRTAVLYATLLGSAGMAILAKGTNLLAVAIVLIGFAVYVAIYSLYLKPRSAYATFVGSLAGAAPPLAGYCAVSGSFDAGAVILLLIFVLWQMPHFYAIAIFRFSDYAAASIPVLPLREGTFHAKRNIVYHILPFLAAAPMLTVAGYTGFCYLVVVAALGLSWLFLAWFDSKSSNDSLWAKKQFIFSLVNIFALSLMMSVDSTCCLMAK